MTNLGQERVLGVGIPVWIALALFAGGLVRYFVERKTGVKEESEISSGTLFSSGLIAGGSLAGILYAVLFGRNIIRAADDAEVLGMIPFLHEGVTGEIVGCLVFLALAVVLYRAAQRRIQ